MLHMKIILLRHGEPDIDASLIVTPREYRHWLDNFNQAMIKDKCLFSEEIKHLTGQTGFVVCSDLPRSIGSAKLMGFDKPDIIDPLFREFEIPYTNWPWPGLSASNWTVLFRVMWLLGYSANAESFNEARRRASACMSRLIEYAKLYGTVLFVGHGALFWYLHGLLKKHNWQCSARAPRRHWEYTVYSLAA